jgi:pimeloyl-ACP methyl ester carboxylesterase
MKWLRRSIVGIVVVLVVAYAGVLAYVYVNQRALQYDMGGKMFALSETGLKHAELVSVPSTDGAMLAAWWEPPQPGKPLIVYYRGNALSFSREHARYEAMEADGYGFVAFDYRGFGGTPGEVSQDHILADGLAAFDWAAAKGFPLVIWGRSLGSGPATFTASQRDADALLLETPFDSAVAVGVDRYWFLPVGLLMSDQYPVDQWITGVTEPVFVAHGTADTTIGVQHGQRVYDLAPNKAGIWIVPGADHDGLWAAGEWDKAKAFFAGVEANLGR